MAGLFDELPATEEPSLPPAFPDHAIGGPEFMLWKAKLHEWWEWHLANPLVWKYFETFAQEAVDRDRDKLSHWLIVNRIRWEVFLRTTPVGPLAGRGEDFKISNDYIAFYARLWKATHPEHATLFTTKAMIGEPPSPLIGS